MKTIRLSQIYKREHDGAWQLYNASVEVEFVVYAKSLRDAEEVAENNVEDALSNQCGLGCCDVRELGYIPSDWDRSALPYGDAPRGDMTIGQIIDEDVSHYEAILIDRHEHPGQMFLFGSPAHKKALKAKKRKTSGRAKEEASPPEITGPVKTDSEKSSSIFHKIGRGLRKLCPW